MPACIKPSRGNEVFATIRAMSTSNKGKPVVEQIANESQPGPPEALEPPDSWLRLRAISLHCFQQPVSERSQIGTENWKLESGRCRTEAPAQGSFLSLRLSILNCVSP